MTSSSWLEPLLETLVTTGGTDLLLTAGTPPLIRRDGELLPVAGTRPLRAADTAAAVRLLLAEREWAVFDDGGEVDFSFSFRDDARIRGNAFRQRGAATLALRVIPRRIPSFDELHLPPAVRGWAARRQGLVFVTGPTGSGKSTTLASVVDWINEHRHVHVLTIEDPIEYVHDYKRAAVNQREVGTDTATFAQALRSALREDPDVLLVGEMRDLESIRFALTLAETGHLVLATLHTNDTAQAIDRVIDVFPADQQPQIRVQLANTLTGVVYQRLLPRVTGGQVAAYEVLVATPAVRNLVKEGKTNQLRNQLVMGQQEGSLSLELSLNALVRDGIVAYEEAVSRSLYPKDLRRPAGAVPPLPA
jgi:twitching motility protein PilT